MSGSIGLILSASSVQTEAGEGLDLVPGHHSAGSTPESGLFAPYMLALTPFVSQPRTKITP